MSKERHIASGHYGKTGKNFPLWHNEKGNQIMKG